MKKKHISLKKALKFVGFFSVFLLFSISCNSEKKEIKKAAQAFLDAYYMDNFDQAKEYSTYNTHSLIDQKKYYQSLDPYYENKKEKAKIKEIILKSSGNGANIIYTQADRSRPLTLKKIDGQWKVDMNAKDPIEAGISLSNDEKGEGYSSSQSDPIQMKNVK